MKLETTWLLREYMLGYSYIHHFHIDHNATCLPSPPPPPKFYITIVLDFSLDDCNTLEKLETMVLQSFGEGRGDKQGALWSMVYEISFKATRCRYSLSLYIVIQNSLPELLGLNNDKQLTGASGN